MSISKYKGYCQLTSVVTCNNDYIIPQIPSIHYINKTTKMHKYIKMYAYKSFRFMAYK